MASNGRTKQCSGLAIKSVLMENPRSRAADCGRSGTGCQSQSQSGAGATLVHGGGLTVTSCGTVWRGRWLRAAHVFRSGNKTMTSKLPVVRQIDWRLVPLQLAAGATCIALTHLVLGPGNIARSLTIGSGIYLLYSMGSRAIITAPHRRGVQLAACERFAEAIAQYERSYRFFCAYPWVDKFRGVVLMSPSALPFREMALLNMGFCYAQLGDAAKSKECYQAAQQVSPDSAIAKAALAMIETFESNGGPKSGNGGGSQ